MAIDLFLEIEGIEGPNGKVIDILAFSFGLGSYRRREPSPRPKEKVEVGAEVPATPVKNWSVADVKQWLTAVNMAPYVKSFEENEINGVALNALGNDDFKALGITKIGHQKILSDEVRKLSERDFEEEEAAKEYQDISMTIWQSSATAKMLTYLNTKKVIPKAKLYGFRNRSRGGGYGRRNNDDDDSGEQVEKSPSFMLELINASITSYSGGGSGGEDRLTANISMSYQKLAVHLRDSGSKVRDAVKGGASVILSTKRTDFFEVSSNPRWRKDHHYVFPQEFKEIVKLMLLDRKRKNGTFFILPEGVFFTIIQFISEFYEARSPLALVLHPNPPKVEEDGKPKKTDEDDE